MDPFAYRAYFDLFYVPASLADPLPHYEAKLGAWLDCNGDGIIGSAAGDIYATLLLIDMSRCPVGSRHNDGVQVVELLAIGPGAPYPHIGDSTAMGWIDALAPGEAAPALKTTVDDDLFFDAATLRWGSAGAWVTQPAHMTGYVSLGASQMVVNLPNNIPSVYGASPCATAGSGIVGNWDCDATHWPWTPRVGDAYHLRDTDCAFTC